MLKEGDIYQFLIFKTIVLPDGEEFYLLKSPFNTKHLLSKKLYLNYGFKLNQYITCKIDRINCSSRIFIEPEHPFYKTNEIYEFRFIRFYGSYSFKNLKKNTILLQDKQGIEYTCITDECEPNYLPQSLIKFKLLRIKKGIFYIQINRY